MRALPSFIILGKRYKFSINRNRPLIRQFIESGFILLAEEERSELVEVELDSSGNYGVDLFL
jgi:hypothetical protein